VDEAAGERVVVFGSLPPEGRDLDLLVRPAAERAIAAELERRGVVRNGSRWALFADGTAYAVELVPAASWGLPAPELERLFADARGLEGRTSLAEPSPPDVLLIAARKTGGRVDAKARAKIDRALADDPDAWAKAASRAEAWGAARSLASLQHGGRGRRSLRGALARARRGRVVSLSGLDGSGKSSQAEALRSALEQLGYGAAVEWTPFASTRWIRALSDPLKRRIRRGRPADAPPVSFVARPGEARAGSSLVTNAWATVMAVANGLAQQRVSLPHRLRGRVVIFDRYTLDSAVHLRYLYGEARSFGLQNFLIRALSPRPVRSFFLEVEPETVVARKPIQYDLEHVRKQARLYADEHERRGARRLDGERSPDDLAAEIAADVWRALLPPQ